MFEPVVTQLTYSPYVKASLRDDVHPDTWVVEGDFIPTKFDDRLYANKYRSLVRGRGLDEVSKIASQLVEFYKEFEDIDKEICSLEAKRHELAIKMREWAAPYRYTGWE